MSGILYQKQLSMSATKSFSVGIADIPNQIHYSSRKERITLNIALLGKR